ncbi:nuclease-related domain-containing protein [Rubritalea marina]|uniref:nuclease-related domain-containing protein n=1 Tax=Rubritalea marina TaxID=361055 RepID=UPI00037FDDBE|nr:NERD domain-containing protein [Rubritalea marina]
MNIGNITQNSIQSIWDNFGWMLILAVVIFVLKEIFSLPTIKGRIGEGLVNRSLKRLPTADYKVYHDLYLDRPDGEGSTQVDHLVVSRFGLFVIETKNYQGWIFGDEKHRQWTQQIYRKKSKFQNPLHQNQLHIRALECFLGLERNHFHNIIYFTGDCTFKTKLPANVMKRGLLAFIKAHQEKTLRSDTLTASLKQLDELVASSDKKQLAISHKRQLHERRHASPKSITRKQNVSSQTQGVSQAKRAGTPLSSNRPPDNLQIVEDEATAQTAAPLCPKCQIPMLHREAKRGANVGKQFWGCANFPKCRCTS